LQSGFGSYRIGRHGCPWMELPVSGITHLNGEKLSIWRYAVGHCGGQEVLWFLLLFFPGTLVALTTRSLKILSQEVPIHCVGVVPDCHQYTRVVFLGSTSYFSRGFLQICFAVAFYPYIANRYEKYLLPSNSVVGRSPLKLKF
jgi:hypothetical protein